MSLFKVSKQKVPKALHEMYIVPPFSVFNTHQPYWRQRTKMWNDMGIGGTNGRKTSNNGLCYDNRRMDKYAGNKRSFNGTSTFSPVLCEVMYKWFTIPNSNIFDPFAGGITRGAIASILGHDYLGWDINDVQIESNYKEFDRLIQKYDITGTCEWECRDTFNNYCGNKCFDLVFTCPPYFNLERYTDIQGDLSLIDDYDYFLEKYTSIIHNCYMCLNDDSFMVWVVSDVRDKHTTEYYGLVADTIKSAQQTGFKFYNEIILYNDTGNLAIVSGDYLNKARKVGRQHQNVLVFYKGDTKNIGNKFNDLI